MKKKKTLVAIIALLLVVVVGATFAYFQAINALTFASMPIVLPSRYEQDKIAGVFGEGKVQWTLLIAIAEKQPTAVAFCHKAKVRRFEHGGIVLEIRVL